MEKFYAQVSFDRWSGLRGADGPGEDGSHLLLSQGAGTERLFAAPPFATAVARFLGSVLPVSEELKTN